MKVFCELSKKLNYELWHLGRTTACTSTIHNYGARAIWKRQEGHVCCQVPTRVLNSKRQPLHGVKMKTHHEAVTSYS